MNLPNFFIIGAPKCGTTSVAAWLAEHPQVYMSPIKEPAFFNFDHRNRGIRTLSQYRKLFTAASTSQHIAVGEASVWYLYSKVAVPEILRVCGSSSRFIVMLRNPLEMAPSLHQQKIFSRHEHIQDFQAAWNLQHERRNGGQVIRNNIEPLQLVYGDVCKLGAQLQRLYNTVPREYVLPLLLDDLAHRTHDVYLRLLDFLKLDDDARTDFPRLNEAKMYRFAWIQEILSCAARAKNMVGIYRGTGIGRLNRVQKPSPNIGLELRAEMSDYFKDDIYLLSTLIRRDLTTWLSNSISN